MRAINFKVAWGCACALMISSCAYEHPGPKLPDDALPSSSEPSTPTPVALSKPAKPKPVHTSSATPTSPEPSKPKPAQTESAHPSDVTATNSAAAPAPAPVTVPTTVPVAAPTTAAVPATTPVSKPANQPIFPLFPVRPDRTPSSTIPDPGTISAEGAGSLAASPAPAVSSTPESAGMGSNNDSSFDNLEVVDASLKGKLAVLRVGSEPTPNNLLSVFVGLKNKTSQQLNLEMQTVYKDKAGNELNTGSWIAITLKSHEESEYRSASISSEATDFMIRIRGASDAGTGDNQ